MKTLLVCLLVLAAGCARENEPVAPGGGSNTIVEGTVEYHAESLILKSFPVQVVTHVQLTNTGAAPVTVTFPDGCLVFLRVYRDAARTQLAYDSERVLGCTDALVPVSIESGASENISTGPISAAKILGDSLPNATYYLAAVVRPDNRRLELQAGFTHLAQ